MTMTDIQIERANLDVFSEALMKIAEKDKDILVVTSDSRGSGKLGPFAERFPDQIVEVGIAEQNMVGVSAGLASTGKKVFAVSPGSFLTARALEQIKNDVAYSDYPVVLVGISSGVSYGALGSTHHSLHDLAALRAINNLTVVIPADAYETEQAILQASVAKKPVFIRFGKKPMPLLPRPEMEFEFGKASVISTGSDVSFIATGETVAPAYEASKILADIGISAGVVSMHTIKPLDKTTLIAQAKSCRALISVEEHSVHGGLGEACASALMTAGIHLPFKIIGIADEDTKTGSQVEIFDHYGISGRGLSKTALSLLK
ncbi:MAG: transketolase family protein [Bacteroidales bacterium]|nr:transketolase family protein [Bacteroidales bacterium]